MCGIAGWIDWKNDLTGQGAMIVCMANVQTHRGPDSEGQYIWNIPWEMKTVDGIEKGILRRALAHVLPQDVRNRKKSAYPITHNPAYYMAIRN